MRDSQQAYDYWIHGVSPVLQALSSPRKLVCCPPSDVSPQQPEVNTHLADSCTNNDMRHLNRQPMTPDTFRIVGRAGTPCLSTLAPRLIEMSRAPSRTRSTAENDCPVCGTIPSRSPLMDREATTSLRWL